jgi:L-rhamnonate dehydratase
VTLEIRSLHATCHRVIPSAPYLEEGNTAWQRDFVMVRLETQEGIVAHGLTASAPTGMIGATAAFINTMAAPRMIESHASALSTERVWEDLFRRFNYRALGGMWSQAMSAIDIALWDARGKFFQQPISRLLGGAYDTVPTYVTFGWPKYDTPSLTSFAKDLVRDGHKRLKMTVGGHNADLPPLRPGHSRAFLDTVETDAARVAAVRDAVGPDIEIMVDGNCSMRVAQAKRLCRLIEPLHISFFEEPVWLNDPQGLRELRDQTSIPISAGQNLGSSWDHRRLVEAGSVDILQPNVCFVGGYTEGVKVANLARTFGVQLGNGAGWPHHNLHLQASSPNGGMVEYFWGSWKVGEMIYDDPPPPTGGEATVSDRPGLGFEPDWEFLTECEVAF